MKTLIFIALKIAEIFAVTLLPVIVGFVFTHYGLSPTPLSPPLLHYWVWGVFATVIILFGGSILYLFIPWFIRENWKLAGRILGKLREEK